MKQLFASDVLRQSRKLIKRPCIRRFCFKETATAASTRDEMEDLRKLPASWQEPFTGKRQDLVGRGPVNPTRVSIEDRYAAALSVGEECIMKEDLYLLLRDKKTRPVAYDGFEPSGRMHIAQGLCKAHHVNLLTYAGCDFVFWIADYFALLNDKCGGDMKKIQLIGKYFIEVWKAAGMDMKHVYFKWASEDIDKNAGEYWMRVMDVSRNCSITRLKRCCTILGRQESDEMPTAHLLYAAMQCADIFHLRADICSLGMDQRKVNALAREYAAKKKIKKKPVILSHHMLMGLKQGQEKMSKSDSNSAIFMDDEAPDVMRKLKKAYCPPGVVEGNPCLDYAKHIIFPRNKQFCLPQQDGSVVDFKNYAELEQSFVEGYVHPLDLKRGLAIEINEMLEPVRIHFRTDPEAKELLRKVQQMKHH